METDSASEGSWHSSSCFGSSEDEDSETGRLKEELKAQQEAMEAQQMQMESQAEQMKAQQELQKEMKAQLEQQAAMMKAAQDEMKHHVNNLSGMAGLHMSKSQDSEDSAPHSQETERQWRSGRIFFWVCGFNIFTNDSGQHSSRRNAWAKCEENSEEKDLLIAEPSNNCH